MKLPEDQRLKHWRKFDMMGAFDTDPKRWQSIFSPPKLENSGFSFA